MNKTRLLLLTIAISILACFNAFAGRWERDDNGWYYDNGDSTYARDGWTWIDGICYYFTSEGYCLVDTTTPDGYQVDEMGAWVLDGVIQRQTEGVEVNPHGLKFEVPAGFYFFGQRGFFNMYASHDQMSVIGTYDFVLEADVFALGLDGADLDQVLDYVVSDMGVYSSNDNYQLSSGVWRRYVFPNGNAIGTPGTFILYARFSGTQCQMVFFGGDVANTDTDAIMNTAVK